MVAPGTVIPPRYFDVSQLSKYQRGPHCANLMHLGLVQFQSTSWQWISFLPLPHAGEGIDPSLESCLIVHYLGPQLKRRISSISAGLGGRLFVTVEMNSSLDTESSGLKRRSNARVVQGLPLIPAPQAEPAKWVG